jgi:hypothetical protein
VEGPDVFGATKAWAIEDGSQDSLVVQCDSEDDLYIAYITPKKPFEEIPTVPATLYIQASGEAPLQLDAVLRSWNDNYAGVVASGRDPQLIAVLREIEVAKSKINVGYDISGNRDSSSFGSRGSTQAMKSLFDACQLSDVEAPPA